MATREFEDNLIEETTYEENYEANGDGEFMLRRQQSAVRWTIVDIQ